jgi:hypothetical protein
VTNRGIGNDGENASAVFERSMPNAEAIEIEPAAGLGFAHEHEFLDEHVSVKAAPTDGSTSPAGMKGNRIVT